MSQDDSSYKWLTICREESLNFSKISEISKFSKFSRQTGADVS